MSTASPSTLAVAPALGLSLSPSRASTYSSGSRASFRSALSGSDALLLPPTPTSPNRPLGGDRSRPSSAASSFVVKNRRPPTPPPKDYDEAGSVASSASSSSVSLGRADQEDRTITADRAVRASVISSYSVVSETERMSSDDLQYLAISTHITELSYSISDIQTRIFEIQELRHKSQAVGDAASSTSVIDKSLMALDERLEAVAQGVQAVNDSMEPILQSAPTPTAADTVVEDDSSERSMLIRKHEAFTSEWGAVQEESEVLREELKEDKWLTVFRTVTDQADGMMSSLEKAVNRCQEFIWQVHRHGPDDSLSPSNSLQSMSSTRSEKNLLTMENFQSLLDSFEAKKKHYMPATTKVLSIIDKGVQDRVTKNGECLRRHAESTQRWKQLRDRISRTDSEMENIRKVILGMEMTPSESASSTASATKNGNGYLTPPSANNSTSGSKSRSGSTSALSRSMSPFRKIARKLTGSVSGKSGATGPTATPQATVKMTKQPSSEPTRTLRNRSSMFILRSANQPAPSTPTGHKYSHSLTPDSSPSALRVQRSEEAEITLKGRSPQSKIPWNSSTKVGGDMNGSIRYRTPSSSAVPPVPPIPGSTPYKRSLSRSSMSSPLVFSPESSTASTTQGSTIRTPSRAPSRTYNRPPSRTYLNNRVPSRATTPLGTPPSQSRTRPKTPSNIPSPSRRRGASISRSESSNGFDEDETSLMQRAFSPGPRSETPGGTRIPHARPPSRSMIPAPVFHVSSPSRPPSAMSDYAASVTSSGFRTNAMRAQTPEATLKARAQQIPFYSGHSPSASISSPPGGYSSRTIRPSVSGSRLPPPSSYNAGSMSRAPSRSGAYTPNPDASPVHLYVPGNPRDPLDAEVAAIVNGVAHGLLIERVDPPLRTRDLPREGEEVRAQYAFSTALARKVVTCRLTTLSRAGAAGSGATKKVMVRVGGGWQDLELYMLNRQAGI